MPRKSYKPEEIITKLREAEVRLGQGAKVAEGDCLHDWRQRREWRNSLLEVPWLRFVVKL